jgi:hypothetical protein
MSELEIVLMLLLAFVVYLWRKADERITWLKCVLVAIGKKEAYVEVNEVDHTFCIKECK